VDLADARQLDLHDPLHSFRERFVIADPNLIYLDGNSLGRLPKATLATFDRLVQEEWGNRLIRGWSDWYSVPAGVGSRIGKLIGAEEGEVLLADSTSVNLYKLLCAAMEKQNGKKKIVTDDSNFPSDLYLMQGVAKQFGAKVEVVRGPDGIHMPPESIEAALDEDSAILCLSHVAFKSGFMHNAKRLTQAAHQVGALVIWDLSHSAGAVSVDLANWGADLAVGCTYKYLNGGPGSPAFLYVRKNLQNSLVSPIWGWFGQKQPFHFDLEYQPAEGIGRFHAGTPPILSLAAVQDGVDMLIAAGMGAIVEKSRRQSTLLVELAQKRLVPLGFEIATPLDPLQRGSHVSLAHAEAWRITQSLIHDQQLLPDFRTPDNLRLGIAPLYTSFQDIVEAVNRIESVIVSRSYERYSSEMSPVT
jgi:kynureninase